MVPDIAIRESKVPIYDEKRTQQRPNPTLSYFPLDLSQYLTRIFRTDSYSAGIKG